MYPFLSCFNEALYRHHRHMTRRGHRGFAGFGGRYGCSSGPSDLGFDSLNRGRKLGSADLQLLLLALLAERPSHGYELIKALDERSSGYYAPSPGMVYPALTYLEEIGHASVEAQGTKKLYSITETGRAYLEGQRASADALLEQLAWIGKRMGDVRRAMGGSGDAPNDAAGSPEVRAARRDLKSALNEKAGATPAEQARIREILERAAAEIRGEPGTA